MPISMRVFSEAGYEKTERSVLFAQGVFPPVSLFPNTCFDEPSILPLHPVPDNRNGDAYPVDWK